jgi:hypothetical protein
LTRGLIAALMLVAAGCVESVDLRPAPPTCAAGLRLGPSGFSCEPCRVDADPTPPCPCGVVRHAAPFPYCEGDDAAAECQACTGGIAACAAWDAASGTIRDCSQFQDCCRALAADPRSTPCCLEGLEVVCTATANLGQYELRCVDPTCCAGTGRSCPNSDGPCAPWQTCDPTSMTCVPACAPGWLVCGASCVCE